MAGLAPKDRVIPALDLPDLQAALGFAEGLQGEVSTLKVGLELFVAEGPPVVRALRGLGFEIFLDLKLHDIPNTVRGAARSAGALGASLLTVHASGGPEMIAAAVEGAAEGADAAGLAPPCVLAVTVLTSMSEADLGAIGLAGPSEAAVARLAALATEAGAGGVVCAPAELAAVRAAIGPGPRVVTPGVRPVGAALDDQDPSRVMTPARALAAGADQLVIGRPIRRAEDPAAAARGIIASLAGA